ncbi:hypothetical protein LJR231_003456 [Phyllobacterium sp. LjRoot231]|uniref:hypothetical protein n=1 Tax=Phyllobacterium sp. LjRoot231 TaxID=3342289 RepID=UPI003ECC7483
MAGIADIRAKFPQYADMSDQQLSNAVYQKFYSDMPKQDFDSKMGLAPAPQAEVAPEEPLVTENESLAASRGAVEGLPIIGPYVAGGVERLAAGLRAPFTDKTYSEELSGIQNRVAQSTQQNPTAQTSGNVVGNIVGTAPLMAAAPAAFGMKAGQGLLARMLAGAGSSGALNSADTATRGGDLEDIGTSGVIGLLGGGAIPVVGAGLRGVGGAIANKVGSTIRSAIKPAAEAGKRVAKAIEVDRAGNPSALLAPDDIAAAARNNQPLMNADIGGETTRALARSAANQSPVAREMMQKAASDRFTDQSSRITKLMGRVTGYKTDDLMAQDMLKDLAGAANRPAYKRAYESPAAQQLYTPELQEIMQSPAIKQAVKDVTGRSANRSAVEGSKAIQNPFHEAADGSFKLRKKADGTLVTPTLQFWDQVKRNLDSDIGKAQRSGDNSLYGDLNALKSKLVKSLDEAVPEYKAARQGAASFFNAEDALEAGKKFAKSSRMLSEYKRGLMVMKPAEKDLFQTGFASEIIDAAKSAGDRTNVINRVFASPESREKMVMAFGDKGSKEIEAFVRVEVAMDALRNAFGNSTTARQLIESGVVGAGTWGYTGDFNTGLTAAALTGAARYGGKKIDGNVMTKVAEMLSSNDPAVIQRAIQNAASSPQHMAAVDALMKIAGGASRASVLAAPTVAGSLPEQ